MVQNTLFRQCLAAVPEVQKAEFEQTNFTMQTIAKIETALGRKLINIAK